MRTQIIRIDASAPLLFVKAIPAVLRHGDDTLIDVDVLTLVFDLLSGGDGFALVSVTSSDPDTSADDIRGWAIGTADTHGQLRKESSGGRARVYTFIYEARDRAGNTVRATTSVRVGP